MKKKIFIIIVVVIFLVLLVPIPFYLNDGGSIEFRALLYTITKYHKIEPLAENAEFIEGIEFKILGKKVYSTVNKETKDQKTNIDNKNNVNTSANNNNNETNNNVENTDVTQSNKSFVATVLEETTTYMIVEPNEDEEIRKSSDKIRINYGTDHIDYLYGIGRKVIINYNGYIKETYPAQIDSNDILVDGYEKFELAVKTSQNKTKTKILNNKELDKNSVDYNLYYYGLDEVKITIQGKTMPLEEALRSGKMTIDGLIIKANKDFPNAASYDDGGSIQYQYKDYTIIKMHKLDGNRDVYIGIKDMNINDID